MKPPVKQGVVPTIDQRLIRALAHPLRVRILEILSERVASPVHLSEELEIGLSHVAYHTRTLEKCGCLQLVDTAQRRGATEHFYKAVPHAFIGDRIWRRVPRALLGGISGATLQSFMDRAVAALEAGTIDSREDTTLYWMPVRLDEEGWNKVTATWKRPSTRCSKWRPNPANACWRARTAARSRRSSASPASRPPVRARWWSDLADARRSAVSGRRATPTRSSPAASRRCRGRRG